MYWFPAQANDYMNVILHALENVPPLRDYFLRESNYSHIIPPPGDQTFILGMSIAPGLLMPLPSFSHHHLLPLSLPPTLPPPPAAVTSVQRLGELFRKLWNPQNFKAHVSPHEMLQAVASTSRKRFKITEQGEGGMVEY